jgi:hypothetical protein
MKNYIKKIITMLSFTLLFLGGGVSATTIWNTASNDCNSISIVNATTNQGYAYPCWTSSSVSADAGDTLNIRIYYHNTSTITANNTRVVLNAPIGGSTSSTKSFSGSISSDQGGLSLSSVVANLSSSQTITFNSVKWYTNNTSETLTPLLNGQSGSEILSGGLYIGSIAPGWSTQGSLVVSFHVSNTQIPVNNCLISNFNASPTSIVAGGSATLTWNTANCSSVVISNVGSVNNSGSWIVDPTGTTTYVLTAYSASGATQTQSVTVTVVPVVQNNCSISYFNANPTSISSGGSATLTWNTTNCSSVSISNLNYNVPVSGSQVVYPTATTTYVLTAYGSSGITQTQSVTVTVLPVVQNNCLISNFNASPTSIVTSGSATLTWNTTNCISVSISNIGYNILPVSGSHVVYPTATTTYILTAYGSSGIVQTQSVTVFVSQVQNNCSISYFNVSPTSVTSGMTATLSWNTTNCSSVSISNLNYNVPVSGSQVVYPTYTTTYVLTAYGTSGVQQTQSVTVYVNNYNYQNNCSISYFNANPTSISSGGSATLTWNTTNCSSVSISNLNYNVPVSGSQVVYPTYTTTYTLNAYGSGATQTQSVTVFVNSYVAPVVNVVSSCAVSTIPTNITQNSATLNGMLTSSGNYNTYFEYGPTVNLGFQTVARSSNGNTLFSDIITGLNSESIYYFRLVSNCQNNYSRGDLKVFQTLAPNVRPIIVQGTTIVGTSSPIMLKIENRSSIVRTGDTIYYVVTYKNVGSKKLTRPIVQVVIPDGVTYLSSSRGTYSENTKTLSVPIEDLNANDSGTIFLEGRLDSIKSNTREIVTTALLVYTNEKGTQENAMAYVLNNPEGNNNLLPASAFFSGLLDIGLLGWLLILIVILLLILIFRKYFYPKPYTTTKTETRIQK